MFAFFEKLVRWDIVAQVGEGGLRKLDPILTLNHDREFEGQNVMFCLSVCRLISAVHSNVI